VTLIGASKLIKTNLTEKSNKSWGCSSTGRAWMYMQRWVQLLASPISFIYCFFIRMHNSGCFFQFWIA
jgi:hypothetical protein